MSIRMIAKSWIYSFIPLVAIVFVLEGVFYVGGYEFEARPTSRGFDAKAAYLLEDEQTPGAFVTNLFESRRAEKRIPPKGDRYRVLLFGGSNTAGLPDYHLEGLLDGLGSSRGQEFEVINLGREGYGSERVRILFEQAMALDPDLVFIYSGHNEFIEMGFRQQLEQASEPLLDEATSLAAHLRTYDWMTRTLRAWSDTRAPSPEAWKAEHDRFVGFTYAQTLEHLEGYRDNIRSMCELALERGVEVVLSTVIGNLLSPPFSSTLPQEMSEGSRQLVHQKLEEGRAQFPASFSSVLNVPLRDRLISKDWMSRFHDAPFAGDGTFEEPVLRSYEGLFGGAKTYWVPPEEWSARVPPFLETVAAFHRFEPNEEEKEKLQQGLASIQEVLELCPDHPMAHFLSGLFHLMLGHMPSASRSLQLAARFDRAPQKASDATNAIVSKIGEELKTADFEDGELVFFDAEKLFREASPDQIVGWELLMDHCHLHRGAKKLLLFYLAKVIDQIATSRR